MNFSKIKIHLQSLSHCTAHVCRIDCVLTKVPNAKDRKIQISKEQLLTNNVRAGLAGLGTSSCTNQILLPV